MSKARPHVSIMTEECLQYFADMPLIVFYEGTVGAGGHARAILEAHPEIKRYIGCDRDPQALKIAAESLKEWKDKVELIHGDYVDLDEQLTSRKIKKVDGFFLIWGCLLCN